MAESLRGLKSFLQKYAKVIESRTQNTDIAEDEFQRIKQQALEDKKILKMLEGSKEVNRKKNRYKDILPYDDSRIILPRDKFVDGSDYINANKIMDANLRFCYIASQGPMPNTVDDFWRMIWQYDVKLIIMACKEVEMGKARCQRYWPYSDEDAHFKNIKVVLISDKSFTQNMKMRQLKVTKDGKERTVTQLHYMDWPDHGAPETFETILQLITIAREMHPGDDPPILIHCSAGCGRTGAIIAIDYARKLIKARASSINVFDIVTQLRKQRPAMVQTKEQYEFIYEVIREMVTSELSKYDSSYDGDNVPTYVNIGFLPVDKPSVSSNEVFNEPDNKRDYYRSQSIQEDVFNEQVFNSSKKQIILPTEHVTSSDGIFRRSRSLYGKNSPRTDKRMAVPPLPRKVSESIPGKRPQGFILDESTKSPGAARKDTLQELMVQQQRDPDTKNKQSARPALPPNKPQLNRKPSGDNYVNTTPLPPGINPNEEYIAAPQPGVSNSYPMKTQTVNPYLPMKSNLSQGKHHPTIPDNSLLSSAAKKLYVSETETLDKHILNDNMSAQQIISNNIPTVNNLSPLYSSVDKSQVDKISKNTTVINSKALPHGKIVAPYAVTDIGSHGRNELPQQVPSRAPPNKWVLSVQSEKSDAPPLPERTPESFIIEDTLPSPEPVNSQPVLVQQADVMRQPIPSRPPAIQQQPVLFRQQSDVSERPPSPSPKTKKWFPAISSIMSRKQPLMRQPSDSLSPNDELMQKSVDVVDELHALGFPIRINQKFKGPQPQPFRWPKFPS